MTSGLKTICAAAASTEYSRIDRLYATRLPAALVLPWIRSFACGIDRFGYPTFQCKSDKLPRSPFLDLEMEGRQAAPIRDSTQAHAPKAIGYQVNQIEPNPIRPVKSAQLAGLGKERAVATRLAD
jgi:hypothetical protein